jgi:hypothetical protein
MLRTTISYVSVSEPAPLPRLGEVFFDVRGNSRSMRLSWYADTGVAVFSIWQAGMCTGTFRLPMADLSRMIEILERGPTPKGRSHAPVSASRPGADRPSDSDWYYGPDDEDPESPGALGSPGGRADQQADYSKSGYSADYRRSDRGPAGYDRGDYDEADYGQDGYSRPGRADRRDADYGDDGYGAARDYGQAGYGSPGHADDGYDQGGYWSAGEGHARADDYRAQGYPAGPGREEYAADGHYQRGRGYESGSYGSASHPTADYGSGGQVSPDGAGADYLTGEYPDYQVDRRTGSDGGYPVGDYDERQDFRPGGYGTETDASPYRDERFAARYDAAPEAYRNDNPGFGDGYQRDIADAGYPADRRAVSASERYLDPSAPDEAYSYGAEYRYR